MGGGDQFTVISPDELQKYSPHELIILITTYHAGEIAINLEAMGIHNYWSYVWMDIDQTMYMRQCDDDPNEVQKVKTFLSDERSKVLLDAIVMKRRSGFMDYTDIKSFYKSEYFIDEFWSPQDDEVFVDGGAFTGDTIEEFYQWTKGKFRRIYSFEPQKNKYDLVKSKLWRYGDKVNLFKKGLWSCSETLCFSDGDESISGRITEENTGNVIDTCSIDETIHEPVTFIKLDIEGAEIEAIKGARQTITAYKPKLAVCIYHKPEDLLTIPTMIHEMVPEYKMFIRQNGACGFYGTTLYAFI